MLARPEGQSTTVMGVGYLGSATGDAIGWFVDALHEARPGFTACSSANPRATCIPRKARAPVIFAPALDFRQGSHPGESLSCPHISAQQIFALRLCNPSVKPRQPGRPAFPLAISFQQPPGAPIEPLNRERASPGAVLGEGASSSAPSFPEGNL